MMQHHNSERCQHRNHLELTMTLAGMEIVVNFLVHLLVYSGGYIEDILCTLAGES